jgi:hypothetical protein
VKDRKPDDRASAHWPIVPPDATAQDTDPEHVEYSQPGSRWRWVALVALLALVFVGLVGAVLMSSSAWSR